MSVHGQMHGYSLQEAEILIRIHLYPQIYWQIKLLCLEPWALILARAVAGIPCSSCYIVLPIYLKEISDIDLRGALGSLLILNR